MCEEHSVKNWCGMVKNLHQCGLESAWQRNQVDGCQQRSSNQWWNMVSTYWREWNSFKKFKRFTYILSTPILFTPTFVSFRLLFYTIRMIVKHCSITQTQILLNATVNYYLAVSGEWSWAWFSAMTWSFSSSVTFPKHEQSTHLQYICPSRPLQLRVYWYPPECSQHASLLVVVNSPILIVKYYWLTLSSTPFLESKA